MAYQNGPKIVTDSLVMCLDAGNPKSYPGSGTLWTDLSANGCNATLVNGPTFNNSNLGRITFDGSNDYADLSNPSKINGNQVSFSIWINPQNPFETSSTIWIGTTSARYFQIHLPWSNVVYFDAGDSSGFDRIQKSFSGMGGIRNWVFTKNATAGTMKIYVDGTLWHSGSGVTRAVGVPNYGVIAKPPVSSAYNSTIIYSMQFYNKELSNFEVLQNYNATKGRFKL
jgi:hypothetical protein